MENEAPGNSLLIYVDEAWRGDYVRTSTPKAESSAHNHTLSFRIF